LTLRQLWWMSEAKRQQQRMLAVDVWQLWTDKKIDLDGFIQRGAITERRRYPVPQTPLIQQKIAEIRERKKQRREAVKKELADAREARRAKKRKGR
jgi:hypothetical protein